MEVATKCRCGKDAHDGRKTCRDCIVAIVESNKKRRKKRAESGLCRCGSERDDPDLKNCLKCRIKHTEDVSKAQRKNRDNGLCGCGRELASGYSCEICLLRRKVNNIKRIESGICICCGNGSVKGTTMCQKHLDLLRSRSKKINEKKRRATVEVYGGKCVCCGESQYEFLTFDHINNDGAEHRRKLKSEGKSRQASAIHEWAIENNYPDTLQLLCWNCNLAKEKFGVCPHQSKKTNS